MNEVQVGVATFLIGKNGMFLMGKRIGSLGSGTYGLPGGKLDFGETIEQCSIREVKEETGIDVDIKDVAVFEGFSNDIYEGRHFVTLYAICACNADSVAEPKIMEPEKCTEWVWCQWDVEKLPSPLFQPFQNLVAKGIFAQVRETVKK